MSDQEPRKYTMSFEGGETVEKTAEDLTAEQVYACEKVGALNNEIGRLNASLADNTVLRDQTAEEEYTKECKKHYKDVHGRFEVGIHTIVNGVIKTIGEET